MGKKVAYAKPVERASFHKRRKRKNIRWIDRLLALAGLPSKGRLPSDLELAM